MLGQTGSNQKGRGAEKERMRYVNSDLVHPCNQESFHKVLFIFIFLRFI